MWTCDQCAEQNDEEVKDCWKCGAQPAPAIQAIPGSPVDPAPEEAVTVLLATPDSPDQEPESPLEAMRRRADTFSVVQGNDGNTQYILPDSLERKVREGILSGNLRSGSPLATHVKATDGSWKESASTVGQYAKGLFPLRVLFEPVWAHAMAGLKWGSLVGIGLKLLDTLWLLFNVDPAMAFLFLVAIVVCFIPRVGMVGVVIISFMMMKYSQANFFLIGMVAAAVGAGLGCLPGMAVGGFIGWMRQASLDRSPEVVPPTPGVLVKSILLPLSAGVLIWTLYFMVLNPWIMEFLAE